jgi:hypothetical protein
MKTVELKSKKILGFTEEINTCDCCGKSDLKGTYAIDFEGDITYYGSVCAFKVQGVSFDEQKEVKKEYKKRLKATEKFAIMESEYNGTQYSLVKMLRFVEEKKLDLIAFINKYGKICDENDFYIAYSIGHVVKCINK